MLNTLFLVILGGGLVAGLIWLKRKLEEQEVELSSGEEVVQLQQSLNGKVRKLEGTIEVKQPEIWYRVLLTIVMEEMIEGRPRFFPADYNKYAIVISDESGRSVYNEAGSLRPFIIKLQYSHEKRPSGIRREKNIFSRTGQIVLLEFAPQHTGRYKIECECQAVLEGRTEKCNFRFVINALQIVIKENVVPISGRGEFNHSSVKI